MFKSFKKKAIFALLPLFIVCFIAAILVAVPFNYAHAEGDTAKYKVYGTSVRVQDETYSAGLRFHIVMPKADYEGLAEGTKTGTLIVPKQLCDSGLTVDETDAIHADTTGKWSNKTYGGVEYYESITCLTDVLAEYYGTTLVVRGYTFSGGVYTYTDPQETTFGKTAQWAYENDAILSDSQKATIKDTYLKTVTFKDGTNTVEKVVGYGETVTAPEATNIIGWYGADGKQYSAADKITADLTLYAVKNDIVIDSSSASNAIEIASFKADGITVNNVDGTALSEVGEDKAVELTLSNGCKLNTKATVITKYISTVDDVNSIRPNGSAVTGYYMLKNDINVGVPSIAWRWDEFKGTLNGNGKTISAGHSTGGLLIALNGATIKNINLTAIWYKQENGAALLARKIHNSTFTNVTVTVSNGKSYTDADNADNGMGLLAGTGAKNNTFTNFTINADNWYLVSLFGGTEYADSNTFINSSVSCKGLKEVGHSSTTSYATAAGLKINGVSGEHEHTYTNDAGTEVDAIRCSACGESIATFDKTLSYTEAKYINVSEISSVDLSGISAYASVKSIIVAGMDATSAEYAEAKANHGAQTATVVVTDSYGFDHTISVPVIVVTQEFSDFSTLVSTLRTVGSDGYLYGYYTISGNVTGTTSPGTGTVTWSGKGFAGTLDGRGYTIKADFSGFNRGLIPEVQGATFKNLTFETTWINSSEEVTFIGHTVYNAKFDNCTFKVSGGIVYAKSGSLMYSHTASNGNKFTNCTFTASVEVGYWVTLKSDGNLSATFEKCELDCPNGYQGVANGKLAADVDGITEVNDEEYTATEPTETVVINLNMNTDGSVNTSDTFVFDSYGIKEKDVSSIKFNGETINNNIFSVNVSEFAKNYGEGIVTIHYSCGGKDKTLDVPVLLVTRKLTTANDIKNFLIWADAFDGTTDDYKYDGYYMLGNDISYPYDYIPRSILATPSDSVGFGGVFDGAGHTISDIRVTGVYDSNGDYNRWTGFIPALRKGAVIKNVAFTNASVYACSFLSGYGKGSVENVYIEYNIKSANAWNTTVNSARHNGLSITMKDCVISYDATWSQGTLIGSVNSTDNVYKNVYVVNRGTGDDYAAVASYYNNDELADKKYSYPLGGDNFAHYSSIGSFLAERTNEIKSWKCFGVTESGMTVGGKVCLSGSADEKTYEGNVIIGADNSYSNYIIIYEKDNEYALNAATFIAENIQRATGTINYTTNDSGNVLQSLSGGVRVPITTSIPTNLDINSAYIFVGNVGADGQLLAETGKYIVKTVNNCVYIHADNSQEYITATVLFLEQALGYKALSDDTVYYEKVNGSEITMPSMNYECDSAYNLRNVTNAHRTWKNNQLALNGRDKFTVGPVNPDTGNMAIFHNSIYWLDYAINKTTHSAWFRSFKDNGVDVCYSAGGNATEYNAMVEYAATNIRNVLIANPGVTDLTFMLQDNDLTGCSCSTCSANQTNAAVKFLNDVAVKIVALDTADGITGRDFTIYMCAYYYLIEAPTIEMNEHLGVIYAPIRNSAEGKSIYDSANDSVRSQITAWVAKTDNIGFWFYSTLFHNFMMPTDMVGSMLTWLEYAARTVKNAGKDIAWIYVNGQTSQYLPSCFEAFKKYAFAKAEVEILDKVTVDGTNSNYMTQINAYLTELENEFFARNSDGTFNDGGYYGPAAANQAMYSMYKQMCADYGSIASSYTTYEYIGKIAYSGFLIKDYYNMLDEYFASSKTDGYWVNYTRSMIETYMGYVTTAQTALASYVGAMKSVYELHVLAESMSPRFMICVAGGSPNSSYGFYGGYNGTGIRDFRVAFKTDCTKLGLTYYGEGKSMQSAFTKWGI